MTIAAYIGANIKRKEDPRLIQGKATYVGDIQLPGMLYARFIRTPYPHATFKKLDFNPPLQECFLFQWSDFKNSLNFNPLQGNLPNRPLLADGEVRMVGEAVALLVAPSALMAADAVEKIKVGVEYELLPVVIDPEEALKPGSPKVFSQLESNLARVQESGDKEAVQKILAQCPVEVEARIYNQRVAAISLETRGIVADYNAGTTELTVWLSNQAPHLARTVLAEALKIPENRIRVIAPEVGGGFGAKGMVYTEEIIVAATALKLGRPVKWLEDRTENLVATYHSRNQIDFVKIGANEEGVIQALDLRLVADIGAYPSDTSLLIPFLTTLMASGCYSIPAIHSQIEFVLTNTTPMVAYRGAGRPEAAYLVERMVDLLAAKLQMDPVEIRLKNFIPPEAFPYQAVTGAVYDSGEYARALRQALDQAGYNQLREQQAKLREHQAWHQGQPLPRKLMGIGVASYVELGGVGFENSVVRVNVDGSISVFTGTSPHGQGSETTIAQIVADTLGVDIDRIEVQHGDTKNTPYGQGTYGSRSAAVGGSAAQAAAEVVGEKVVKLAAHMLEAAENDIELGGNQAKVKGVPGRSITFDKIARAAYNPQKLPPGMELGLEASRFFNPPNMCFPFGTHVCAIEIDSETGEITFVKYVSVDDCGTVINSLIVDGQIHGGVAQGISQALYEEVVYDENGQLLSGSLMDYTFPTAGELPGYELGRTFTPTDRNPLGAKGIGESGATGAPPTVVNAVLDAMRPFGITTLDMPLRPEKVWQTLRKANGEVLPNPA
jgi:carbon-monoxide dehydrogenase large subunit